MHTVVIVTTLLSAGSSCSTSSFPAGACRTMAFVAIGGTYRSHKLVEGTAGTSSIDDVIQPNLTPRTRRVSSQPSKRLSERSSIAGSRSEQRGAQEASKRGSQVATATAAAYFSATIFLAAAFLAAALLVIGVAHSAEPAVQRPSCNLNRLANADGACNTPRTQRGDRTRSIHIQLSATLAPTAVRVN